MTIIAVNADWTDKDFAVLSGPQLVRWWNAACKVARDDYQMESYREIQKFQSIEVGVKRCALLASALRAARSGAKAEAAREDEPITLGLLGPLPSSEPEEDTMAKKQKAAAKRAAKANGDARKPRVSDVAPKLASEMKMIRTGTDRYRVLSLVDGKRTLKRLGEMAEMEPNYVRQHLSVANRDMGVGYKIDEDGVVTLRFPGSKGLEDYVKPAAAEK